MKVLIVGREAQAESVECQMVMAGHASGHVFDVFSAQALLRRGHACDLIVLVDHRGIETVDVIAERLKQAALIGGNLAPPYVFAVGREAVKLEEGKTHTLKIVDAVLEGFSARQCEEAYAKARERAF